VGLHLLEGAANGELECKTGRERVLEGKVGGMTRVYWDDAEVKQFSVYELGLQVNVKRLSVTRPTLFA
jgi:hypothetical protein